MPVAQLRELARRQQPVSSQSIAQQLERVPVEREAHCAVVGHDIAAFGGLRQRRRLRVAEQGGGEGGTFGGMVASAT
ncbi:hypothetical protein EDD84_00310 (plasmid) [Burkholderia gladioli]|nr:hypothetical protein CO712_35855 [Burkholderia gladioli pv. gladioli]AYQ86006.1 hypothetical protein EDD84_00310 [Burkholderia gladioli]